MEEKEYLHCDHPVTFEEILFTADIHKFTDEVRLHLQRRLAREGQKLVVMVGDIFSLGIEENVFQFNKYSLDAYMVFIENAPSNRAEVFEDRVLASEVVGAKVSAYLEKVYGDVFKSFFRFLKHCSDKDINVVFVSGNHDYVMSPENAEYRIGIPIFRMFFNYDNFDILNDLERIKLDEELYLMGVNVNSDDENRKSFPRIKNHLSSLIPLEDTENTILVTHFPGKSKFKKMGSEDISSLKRRYKFLYHFHGHVRNYYNEYEEEKTPTRSVHFDLSVLEDKQN